MIPVMERMMMEHNSSNVVDYAFIFSAAAE